MTDGFEQAVRRAAQDLGSQGPDGLYHALPTYHDAWQRGRRRRFVKRSVLAAAGAVVFVAALSVNLGRFPGTDTTEVEDVALEVAAATPSFIPTPVATTSPMESPTLAAEAPILAVPTPTALPTQPTPGSSPESTSMATTPVPAPPTSTAATPAETEVPSSAVGTTPEPTPVAVAVPPTTPNPREAADSSQSPEVAPEPTSAAVQPTPDGAAATHESPVGPQPGLATASPLQPADVIVLEAGDRGSQLACDIDQDGKADAICDLLPDYACDIDTKVEPGYERFDSDGDGKIDICRAARLTICDTTGDGLGDTPCIVELIPAAELAESAPANDK